MLVIVKVVVDVVVRMAGGGHLGLHHQTVVPLTVAVGSVDAPGQVLDMR